MGGTKKDIEAIGKTIDKLYTGHCTGLKAYEILKGVLGDNIEYFPTGRSVTI
ncbi:Metal dependent hydrolase [Moritella sp. JT01]|uniref:hypothetical protein n=1 Tax=Moritella sp. JT01 TaxID=756698 RepID=UPI0007988EED|nr:hypothetical protein [Moritella sp. JT01]KXO07980.1 Metal dependent hydrolase [Moritella sp. JT01]